MCDPKQAEGADNYFHTLQIVLKDPKLFEVMSPAYSKLSKPDQKAVEAVFSTNFQMTQLGQGECAPDSLMALTDPDIAQYACGDYNILEQVCAGYGARTPELLYVLCFANRE